MTLPSISVVIPTAGRRAVLSAAASALNQTLVPFEIIVVVDSTASPVSQALCDLSSLVRIFFTGGIGANGARMRGISEAKGEIVAFLDDDDVWEPEKLERQLSVWCAAAQSRRHAVVSCRIALVDNQGNILKKLPSRVLGPEERVAGYLFRRTSIAYGEALLHTSTLMCDRALVELEPWDSGLIRHQDWDWVLRVGQRSDVALRMCPEVLVAVAPADTRSISMSGDWRASLAWLEKRADQLTPRERGDFLLCHTAIIAIRSGSRRGALIAAGQSLSSGRPGVVAWMVWGLHMVSPRFVDRASRLRSRLTLGPRRVLADLHYAKGRIRPTR